MMRADEFNRRAESHLRRLRRTHNISRKAKGITWETSEALLELRVVWAPKVAKPIDYLVNLHEIGHIVSTTAQRYARYPSTDVHAEMMKEAAAWAWAMLEADPALVKVAGIKGMAMAAECFLTYLVAAAGHEDLLA